MKKDKGLVFKLFLLLPILALVLSGCAEKVGFKKGDIKDDFCGAYINFQYCKCAFHNDYCDSIGLSRGDAKRYVNEEYDKWVDREFEIFKQECLETNGYIKGKNCLKCGPDEEVSGSDCVPSELAVAEEGDSEEDEEGNEEEPLEGECKYDSHCAPICEGDVMWKMGCNARTDKCEKTFDTDCSADVEIFGELSFPKACLNGACIRDVDTIESIKSELTQEKQLWSDTVKEINRVRDNINVAMLEANKNCINGIADMTNVAIMEFATRVGSVLAGGIPDIAAMSATAAEHAAGLMQDNVKDLAGAAVDYAGESLNRLYNYQNGEPVEEEKKLKPHEYIKLNCDLYQYFKQVQAESDNDLQIALDNAREVDAMLDALP